MMPPTSIRAMRAMRARRRAAGAGALATPATAQAPSPQPATMAGGPVPSSWSSMPAPGAPVRERPRGNPLDPSEVLEVEPGGLELHRDPPLSPFGRAAIGAAVGGLVTAAFELPGGPIAGMVAGGVLGWYLPVGKLKGGRR